MRNYNLVPGRSLWEICKHDSDIPVRNKTRASNILDGLKFDYKQYENLSRTEREKFHKWVDTYVIFEEENVTPETPKTKLELILESILNKLSLWWLAVPFIGSLPIFKHVYPVFDKWVKYADNSFETFMGVIAAACLVYAWYHFVIHIGASFKRYMEHR